MYEGPAASLAHALGALKSTGVTSLGAKIFQDPSQIHSVWLVSTRFEFGNMYISMALYYTVVSPVC